MTGPAIPPMASLTSTDLLLSIRIPVDSDVAADADTVRVVLPAPGAPAGASPGPGRRATFTIRQGSPEQPGEGWFATFRNEAVARMPVTVAGFVLLGRADFVLSSFVDVTAVGYRRTLPGGEVVSQMQAYLWADSYRMYVVDAATALAREAADLPIFDAMVRSIRLLPPR